MSHDEPDEGPDLDPSGESSDDAVRRLLEQARHREPMPPEVTARLDTLLGQLVEARSAESGVTSLASRRTRRRGLLLVAAAAAVIAVVVPSLNRAGSSSDDAASSADSSAAQSAPEATQDRAGGAASSADEAAPAAPSAPSSPAAAPFATGGQPAVLTRGGFEAEVRAVLLAQPPGAASTEARSLLGPGCALPAGVSTAGLIAATYDGRPAFLSTAAPSAGRQRADLYLCGETDVTRTVTVDLTR